VQALVPSAAKLLEERRVGRHIIIITFTITIRTNLVPIGGATILEAALAVMERARAVRARVLTWQLGDMALKPQFTLFNYEYSAKLLYPSHLIS
jgi:hypothetical protein